MPLSLFIASSYDTAHERAVMGDAVRRLNDKYEPLGCRIRLNCWEDFTPEFKGTRKQTEYNEQLIKKSDIFIALFKANCGRYTQEEIRIWTDDLHRTPIVFNIGDTSIINKSAVDAYLRGQGITPEAIVSDDDIYSKVTTIVEDYIATHPATMISPTTVVAKEIYATIPSDRKSERAPFGNLIRSVDDWAEQTFHSRCHLTTNDVAKISISDYYAAILKDAVSPSEEQEILSAIRYRTMSQKPDVVLYYNHDNQICSNHPAIANVISNSGLFNEAFDSLHRVRFNLVRWLHQQTVLSVELSAGVDIQDGWFVFFSFPVIPLGLLGIHDGTVTQQLVELLKLFSLSVLGVNTHVIKATDHIDLAALDEMMSRANEMSNALHDVEIEIKHRREAWLQQVSDNIDTLLSGEINDANIGYLTALIDRKEQLQELLSSDPRERLRTLMLMVQVSDTYPGPFTTTDRDADAQYLKVVKTADRFGIKDPTVEMMRMNYANYLHRMNHHAEALSFYETAMVNLETFDDRSELVRRYVMHLYVTYINHMAFLGENQRAIYAIQQLVQKEIRWEHQGLSKVETLANHCQILSCQLRIRPLLGNVEKLLNRSKDTYQKVMALPQEVFDSSVRIDIFCDFPNCIASTTIDAQPYLNTDETELKYIVDFFLGQVVDYAEKHIEEPGSLHYLSNALHNWAFFYSNLKGEQLRAREIAERALSVRRQIYTHYQYPESLYEIAQTLLILGATYVNDVDTLCETDFRTALRIAEECLNIYNSLNKEHFPEQETRVYQAIQLKGSILYYGGRKEEGLILLRQAWEWNLAHPKNSYEATFRGVAGEILEKEG